MDTTVPQARIALVTGAAQGIGEAIAVRLADDGLDVVVVGLPQKHDQLEAVTKVIEAKGRRSLALYADVSMEDEVEAMIKNTVEQLGGLDVMIANAGTFRVAPIVDVTVETWETIMAVNARSVLLAIKHAARHMIAQGRGGRIIAASSAAGKRGARNMAVYSASKFAIRGLVQSASIELRTHNITVNSYCPGVIITPLSWHPDDEINGGHGMTVCLNGGAPPDLKPAQPEVVASLVSYLAKPEAYYITVKAINAKGIGTLIAPHLSVLN
ncbi:NAD-P-binding protein [Cubamyces lactineus]|nr:NAD-P-binding protein [Cubamyces lactineus]